MTHKKWKLEKTDGYGKTHSVIFIQDTYTTAAGVEDRISIYSSEYGAGVTVNKKHARELWQEWINAGYKKVETES